jgi:tetratricopeptide (TPR) repeat protein
MTAMHQHTVRRIGVLAVMLLLVRGLSIAQWYVSYENGLKAFRNRQYQEAVQDLSEAIDDQSDSKASKRTYGMQFIDYFPYVYRGVAYFKLGDRTKALEDLQKAEDEKEVQNASTDTEAGRLLPEYLALVRKTAAPPPQADIVKEQNPPKTETRKVEVPPTVKNSDDARRTPDRATKDHKDAVEKPPVTEKKKPVTEPVQTTRTQPVDTTKLAMFHEAVALYTDGRMSRAKVRFLDLRQLDPSYPELATYLQSISDNEEKVRKGIAAFFAGDYQQAIDQLAETSRVGRDNAHAYAFLACSYAAQYLLSGGENSALRKNAADAYGKTRAVDAGYTLNDRFISPKIIALLRGE